MKKYNPQIIEDKWQKVWENEKTYLSKIDKQKQKYYVLEMFPYPSGDIHMGHVRNYTLGDLVARFKRAQGFNVLHPMGWDSFGLPAENAAIENNIHPKDWTISNISKMKSQLKKMGLSYDWDRELSTCDPDYYKHEQKIFLDLYKNNLAYRKETWVNWDPVEQTVLANEQVIDGKGWRSGAEIEKRKMKGWFLKISYFSEVLLKAIDDLLEWPEKVKLMQKNWIGKSIGAHINFNVSQTKEKIKVFTTRPDTIFGASFIALSPQHPFAEKIKNENDIIKKKLNNFAFKKLSEAEMEKAEKIGIKTKYTVQHPFLKNKNIPIYIANFVLIDYGTGAVFGCPAHDQRDLDFAKKYNLEVIPVVSKIKNSFNKILDEAYVDDGYLINSDFLNGLKTNEAKQKCIDVMEKLEIGSKSINYRLRDWGVSRQRYWGCPIPIIHCKNCGVVPVPDEDLPVVLPEDISFDKSGNPLSKHPKWKNVKCPKCKMLSERETDTFDTFFESSWYFARFTDLNKNSAFDKNIAKYWLPVDQYIGGVEHAVLHLLYSRFFIKALNKIGQINIQEPFKALKTQGMVCHRTFKNKDNQWLFPKNVFKKGDDFFDIKTKEKVIPGRIEKMSKSKKNVIDPNTIINNYGADTARFFILSDSPPERDMEWTESGVEGAWRFLNKFWNLINKEKFLGIKINEIHPKIAKDINLIKNTHKFVNEVTKSINKFHFNIAIASIRSLFNEINVYETISSDCLIFKKFAITQLIIIMYPICPHFCEEAWEVIGNKKRLSEEKWPKINEKYLKKDKIIIPIQINGKKRAEILVDENIDEAEIKKLTMAQKNIKKFISSDPKKIIFIPKRIVNIVI